MRLARTILSLTVVILALAAVGCGESAEEATLGSMVDDAAADVQDAAQDAADEAAGVAEEGAADMQEAAGSAMDDAAAMADTIKEELAAKEAELAKISGEIEKLSPQDLLTDDGKSLQARADALMAEIQDLKSKQ